MGEPFGDVLTKIFPSSVQTLNNKPSLLFSFARLTIFLLYDVRFSFKKIRFASARVAEVAEGNKSEIFTFLSFILSL